MKKRMLFLMLIVLLFGCDAQKPKQIPVNVQGTVVDHLPRIEPVLDESGKLIAEAQYFLVIDVTGGDREKFPVTVETAVKAWIGDAIELDCHELPCTTVGG